MPTIEKTQVEKLAEFSLNGRPIASLYLNVTPPRNYTSELKSIVHEKRLKLRSSQLGKDLRKEAEKAIEKLVRYVQGLTRLSNTRLLVVFATSEEILGEWRLPVALPSRLYIEPHPYVRPLSLLLDEFERYCVLVADGRRARIFTLFLGTLEEDMGTLESDTPTKVSEDLGHGARGLAAGGVEAWAGWREPKIQRHIQDHVHRHLKEVAQRSFELFKKRSFHGLIVGAPEGRKGKIFPMLEAHLHSYLRSRLVGVFAGDPAMPVTQLSKRAVEVAQEYERAQEKELVRRLVTESKKKSSMAVLGLEPVVSAVLNGQAHTLAVKGEFRVAGWECPSDRWLSTQEGTCPACGERLLETEDFVEALVEQALIQGTEIEYVFAEEPEFDKEKIGALLRFPLSS